MRGLQIPLIAGRRGDRRWHPRRVVLGALVFFAAGPAAALTLPNIDPDPDWSGDFQNWFVTTSPMAVISALPQPPNNNSDSDRFAWGISGGYRFNPYVGLEVGFVDLGEVAGLLIARQGVVDANSQASLSVQGETFAAVGTLPFGRWDAYLKAGVFFADADLRLTATTDSISASAHTEHALVGVGFDREIAEQWRAQLGFTYYSAVGDSIKIQGSDIGVVSAGIAFVF